MKNFWYYLIALLLLIIVVLFILSKSKLTIIDNIFNKGNSENLTTILKSDNDFYNWFIEFDKLYKKKKRRNYPDLSINVEIFKNINNLLEDKETKVYYKDGKYFISDVETIELDVNTRSIRYLKYKQEKIIEILEIRLVNGKYYLQLINSDYLYRIYFNKDDINKTTYRSNNNIYIEDDESIFQTESFKW